MSELLNQIIDVICPPPVDFATPEHGRLFRRSLSLVKCAAGYEQGTLHVRPDNVTKWAETLTEMTKKAGLERCEYTLLAVQALRERADLTIKFRRK